MTKTDPILKQRKRLYIYLLIFQSLVYLVQLVFAEIYRQQLYPISEFALIILQVTAGICINVANVMFLKVFIQRNTIFYFVVTIVIFSFFLQTSAAALTASSDYMGFSWYRVMQITVSILNLFVLGFTFIVGTRDIFSKKHDLTYSLVGAANIFLLIGFIFSVIYILLQYIFPGIIIPVEQTAELPSLSVVYSAYVLANMDLPVDLNVFVRNIMVVESICAHLYAVMIVGRLLSK